MEGPKDPESDPGVARRLKMFRGGSIKPDIQEQHGKPLVLKVLPVDPALTETSEEALRKGGITRWPAIDRSSLKVTNTITKISEKEELPISNEGRYAYQCYREAGLDPKSALLFATKGFVFKQHVNSPYIPVSAAIRISEFAAKIFQSAAKIPQNVRFPFAEVLEVFLDNNDFDIMNINIETQALIKSKALESIKDNAVFEKLSQIRKKEILGDYVKKGKRTVLEYCKKSGIKI